MYTLLVFLSVITMMCFPMFTSPVSLGMLLFLTSVFVVLVTNFLLSMWYSYILFLVYVGGLLVLFIYMCMMSSNEKFFARIPNFLFIILILWYFFTEPLSETSKSFLGFSNFESSYFLSLSLFMSLVVVLLITFLTIMRIVSVKKPLNV
uniref:NADH dehydrogenase subunit 6 n=1 Tax=Planorbella pilsbryi TaxID=2823525 RepID=A0A8E8U503_9GAST|nr:NADH dehydrogenase subunit 6 [Planorbella pilsbryi]